jgi:nucleotide-binding universal stress UspA family protein
MKKAAIQGALEEAEAYLQEKQEALSQEGLLVKCVAGLDPADELIQATARQEQASLVVMASHGRGWLGHLVLGSVTKRILSHVETPVLLVRQMKEEETPTETTPAETPS